MYALSEANDRFNLVKPYSHARLAEGVTSRERWKIHLQRRATRILRKDKSVNVGLLICRVTRGRRVWHADDSRMCMCNPRFCPMSLDFAPTVAVELSAQILYLSLSLAVQRRRHQNFGAREKRHDITYACDTIASAAAFAEKRSRHKRNIVLTCRSLPREF